MPQAADLSALGYAAYRKGNPARARQHFERALALLRQSGGAADIATALSDVGAAAAAMGDHAAALACHHEALALRRVGAAPAPLAATLHNLGITYRNLGQYDAAQASHREAIALWQGNLGADHAVVGRGLTSLAIAARLGGDAAMAHAHFRAAENILQAAGPAHANERAMNASEWAALHMQQGDFASAEQAWAFALRVWQSVRGKSHPSLAPTLNNLGVAARQQNNLAKAAAYFAAAHAAAPQSAGIQHSLAATLHRLGKTAEASRHRNQALARENVFVQQAPSPAAPRVLILATAQDGNVPLEHLLPEQDFTRIWWFAAHGAARQATALPRYDVVFNGIGDADMAGDSEAVIAAFRRGCAAPLLNDPPRIAATRRDTLGAALRDIPHCRVPATVHLHNPASTDARRHAEQAGIEPPFLLRPVGAHGGTGVIRAETWNGVAAYPPETGPCYATGIVDCRGSDSFYRKYRIIYVDRRPYPYHLAISEHWVVHYFSAHMAEHPWKLAEEAAFLADWQTAIGPKAAQAIIAIGQRLDLDFCGVDFAIAPDGELVVFEANATMLVHPEAAASPLAFKNPAVSAIFQAFARRINTVIRKKDSPFSEEKEAKRLGSSCVSGW